MALNDQMVCLCAYGRTGPLCEVEFNVTRPYFEGTTMGHASYLSLTLPPFDLRDHFEAKFQFVTDDSRQVALLLFVGRTSMSEEPEEINSSITDSNTNQTYFQQQQQYPNPNLKDFLAVSFIRGHVALTWDLGSGTRRIFTAQPVATTQTGGHSVHVGRRGRGENFNSNIYYYSFKIYSTGSKGSSHYKEFYKYIIQESFKDSIRASSTKEDVFFKR